MRKYKTGALISPKDPRDIPVSAIHSTEPVPKKYFTDVTTLKIRNQRNLGACVGHAHATVLDYLNTIDASPRYIYALSKQIDGYAGEGTFPRVTAKIMTEEGCANESVCENDTTLSHADYIKVKKVKSAKENCTEGYAYVNHSNIDELKSAIVKYGLVTCTLVVGDWSKEKVKPTDPKTKTELANGLHRVVIYGYNGDNFYFINSWGAYWGNRGRGYFNYNEYSKNPLYMQEFMVFTDIPKDVLKEYKSIQAYKYFSNTEIKGLVPKLCAMLDEARGIAGIPFKINSGLRTSEQNAKAGGVKDSAHLKGMAVDLRAKNGAEMYTIVNACMQAGFKRIGINRKAKFVHVDIDDTKPSPTIYEYDA